MSFYRWTLVAFLLLSAVVSQAQPAAGTPEALFAAARQAAGLDHAGTYRRICGVPDNRYDTPRLSSNRAVPDRDTWYARPYRVFDNLYFIGTRIHSSWALTTSDGIIVIDSVYEYAVEAEMIEGLRSLGLDPNDVRYILISHAHGDHDQGAAIFQRRFGTEIVMGDADWESTLARAEYPGGVPKRDIGVGPEGMNLTLGDTTVEVIATPGHTPGTFSMLFEVKDNGTPLTVAYNGGTAFNFINDVPHFDTYIASQKKMADAAARANATVLMTNHSEFDSAVTKIRLMAARKPGEPHPYTIGREAVGRYFKVTEECAQVARLKLM